MVNPIIDTTIPLANINRMLDGNTLYGQAANAANAGVNPYLKELQLAFLNGINSLTTTSDTIPGAASVGVRASAYPGFDTIGNEVYFYSVDDALAKIGTKIGSMSSGNADSYGFFIKYPYSGMMNAARAIIRVNKTISNISADMGANSGILVEGCSALTNWNVGGVTPNRGDASAATISNTNYVAGGSAVAFNKTNAGASVLAGQKAVNLTNFTMLSKTLTLAVYIPLISNGTFDKVRVSLYNTGETATAYVDLTHDVSGTLMAPGKWWTVELIPADTTKSGWDDNTVNTRVSVDIYTSSVSSTFNGAGIDNIVITDSTLFNMNVYKNGVKLLAAGETYTLPDVKVGTFVSKVPTDLVLLTNDIITVEVATTGTYSGENANVLLRTI